MNMWCHERRRGIVAQLLVLTGVVLAGQASAQDDAALKTDRDRLSYALGMDLGSQLRKLAVEVDPALFGQGLADALSGGKTRMTQEEVRLQIQALQDEMRRRQAEAKAAVERARAGGPIRPPPETSAGGGEAASGKGQ